MSALITYRREILSGDAKAHIGRKPKKRESSPKKLNLGTFPPRKARTSNLSSIKVKNGPIINVIGHTCACPALTCCEKGLFQLIYGLRLLASAIWNFYSTVRCNGSYIRSAEPSGLPFLNDEYRRLPPVENDDLFPLTQAQKVRASRTSAVVFCGVVKSCFRQRQRWCKATQLLVFVAAYFSTIRCVRALHVCKETDLLEF